MAKSSKEHGRNSNTLLAPKKRKVHENSLANLKRNGHGGHVGARREARSGRRMGPRAMAVICKTGQAPEPERIKAFRLWLAKQIPRFPNNRASLKVLEAKPLGPLLVDCLNWRIRYVEPRSRAVVVEASATSDPRWQSLSSDIDALLSKVEQGHNLTPYLSPRVHTRGFTPAASGPDADRWADKDMLFERDGLSSFSFGCGPAQ
jgi:hypothetical protein